MEHKKEPLNPDHDKYPKVPPGEVPIPREGEELLAPLFEEKEEAPPID